jgi:porin
MLDGWGASFSAATFIDGKWMPFLRAGYSHDGGALWEKSVSTGLGYYMKDRSDLLGLAVNWSRPFDTAVGPGLDDKYTIEAFYRIQLTSRLAITPDIQLIVDPALNPKEDKVWFFGLRTRLAL